MMEIVDEGRQIKKGLTELIDLDESKIVIDIDKPIQMDIELLKWEKAGLRTHIEIGTLNLYGHYNDEPYPNEEVAIKDYKHVLEQVKKGNYELRYTGRNEIKLILTNKKC